MPAKRLTEDEIERRTPVWSALADLWLDTELQESDLIHIAAVMVDSGYSLNELRAICDAEVAPVVYKNLLMPVGAWSGFDEHWLAQQIIAEMYKPKRWQDALFDPIRRAFNLYTHEPYWPTLVLKYQEIQRKQNRIAL